MQLNQVINSDIKNIQDLHLERSLSNKHNFIKTLLSSAYLPVIIGLLIICLTYKLGNQLLTGEIREQNIVKLDAQAIPLTLNKEIKEYCEPLNGFILDFKVNSIDDIPIENLTRAFLPVLSLNKECVALALYTDKQKPLILNKKNKILDMSLFSKLVPDTKPDYKLKPGLNLIHEPIILNNNLVLLVFNSKIPHSNYYLLSVFDFTKILDFTFNDFTRKHIQASVFNHGQRIYFNFDKNINANSYIQSFHLNFYNLDLIVHLCPDINIWEYQKNVLPVYIFIIGIISAMALGILVRILQISLLKLAKTKAYTRNLQTELKKKEEMVNSLNKLAKELELSLEEIKNFSTIISHDLQVPLATVIGYVELIKTRYSSNFSVEANEFFNYISDNSYFMRGLINDLLKYAKINFTIDEFDLIDTDSIINIVIESLNSIIVKENAKIQCEPLPKVYGKANLLSQVFLNLVANAIKFRSSDSPIIIISAEIIDQYWMFSIKDNGIGINLTENKDLFTIFKRGDNAKLYPGNGLGLAICKKIITAHHGKIWIDSKPGRGSTFYFTLPIAN